MSVEAIDARVRSIQHAGLAAAADGAASSVLPPVIQDAQGRSYSLQTDPVTGHPQYHHAGQQRDAGGNTLSTDILIDLQPDGGYSRRVAQQLSLVNGDLQSIESRARYDAAGRQLGEESSTTTRQGDVATSEQVRGTYAGGVLVRREADVLQEQSATSADGEQTGSKTAVHATWFADGAPITDATVPTLDRRDTQTARTPGAGINVDTDRLLTFTRHATGPSDALRWDANGSLVVRFNGRGAQYLERELQVPLGAGGEPDMASAVVVRDEDHQNLVAKGLMQARIWGGLASNITWITGILFARGGTSAALLGASAAASGAQFVGEAHAVATRRNDGDWGRVAMSAYDLLLTGMLAAYRSGSRRSSAPGAGLLAAGTASVGMNVLRLGGVSRHGDAPVGFGLLSRQGSRPLLSTLELDSRFDAARAVLG